MRPPSFESADGGSGGKELTSPVGSRSGNPFSPSLGLTSGRAPASFDGPPGNVTFPLAGEPTVEPEGFVSFPDATFGAATRLPAGWGPRRPLANRSIRPRPQTPQLTPDRLPARKDSRQQFRLAFHPSCYQRRARDLTPHRRLATSFAQFHRLAVRPGDCQPRPRDSSPERRSARSLAAPHLRGRSSHDRRSARNSGTRRALTVNDSTRKCPRATARRQNPLQRASSSPAHRRATCPI